MTHETIPSMAWNVFFPLHHTTCIALNLKKQINFLLVLISSNKVRRKIICMFIRDWELQFSVTNCKRGTFKNTEKLSKNNVKFNSKQLRTQCVF